MAENLVIVESPGKVKTIQKFLGSDFVVKASLGHIRDLNEKSLSIDIDNGFTPEYVIPDGKKRVVADLKAAADKAATIWLASDEDREGEAISWHLMETLRLDPAKTRRIVFHEITKTAILEAIKNPRDIDMNLVDAQQARRILDRLVGFELSPVLWRKIRRGLSAGRVQSVALRLIVDREREIEAFDPSPYWHTEAMFSPDLKGVLDRTFETADDAAEFLKGSIGAAYTVRSVAKKEGTRTPAAPFITSTLQQEAARLYHMSSSATMSAAQSLYERGLITYMRTDSTNLSSMALGAAKAFIVENFGAQYSKTRQYRTKSKGAQEAHEAIRPTYIGNTSVSGTAQEQKLYDLIWKRTVASQMADARIMNTTIRVEGTGGGGVYDIKGAEVLFDGFLKLGGDVDQTSLPALREGDVLECREINSVCKFREAPARYTEGTLVKKLDELGIGRPSTYAPIISTLTTGRGYVVKGNKEGVKTQVKNLSLKGSTIKETSKTEYVGAEKNRLLPQDVGIIVTDYLVENFADILDYDFTANVEKDFDSIAEGGAVWNKVISGFYGPFHTTVKDRMNDGTFSKVERVLGTDPVTGEQIVAKFGQFGPFIQKGDGDARQCVSLDKGQLIESITLEQALKMLSLPRTVGSYEGADVIVANGRYGAYIRYSGGNCSLPKGADPFSVTLEDCLSIIASSKKKSDKTPLKEFPGTGISILDGRYGAYIKYNGGNYRIPKGRKAENLTEEDCRKIIEAKK